MASPRITQLSQKTSSIVFIILLLLLSIKIVATTSSTKSSLETNSLAYIQSNNNNKDPKSPMRAWMCHGRTHKDMIEKLASAGIVNSPVNIQALLKVDRKNYVINPDHAYDDSPQPIGFGATISAPHMHAHVLEELLPSLIRASKDYPERHLSLLDVGCGSGYLTAVFGRMVEHTQQMKSPSQTQVLNKGKVYGIDIIPQLVQLSKKNINKEDGDLFDSNVVDVIARDGWHGYPQGAPYDAIHVGAAAETFPMELMNQLTVGGVMVVPVGPNGGVQYLFKIERIGDKGTVVGLDESKGFCETDFAVHRVLGVRYVPLVRAE